MFSEYFSLCSLIILAAVLDFAVSASNRVSPLCEKQRETRSVTGLAAYLVNEKGHMPCKVA